MQRREGESDGGLAGEAGGQRVCDRRAGAALAEKEAPCRAALPLRVAMAKKFGGVLRVPRPSHSKKKPGAEEEFNEALCEKLGALGLEAGSRVKVWMMDKSSGAR